MTSRRNRDDAVEHLLRTGADHEPGDASADCPEPELMAAFVERTLPPGEASTIERHASACGRCQAQLAALVRSEPAAEPSAVASWRLPWRWLMPATAAAAASALLWVAVDPPGRLPEAPAAESRTAGATDRAEAVPDRPGQAAVPPDAAGDATRMPQARPESERARAEPAQERFAPVAPPSAAAPPGPAFEPTSEPASQPAPQPPADTTRADRDPAAGATAPTMAAPKQSADQRASPARPAQAERPAVRRLQVEPADESVAYSAALAAGPAEVVSTANPSVRWRLGPAASIARSADSGTSWQAQESGVTRELLAGSSPAPMVCWVVGRGGVITRTIDGTTWTPRPSPTALDLVGVEATDADSALVSTVSGERFRTTDGGVTWEPLP